MDREIVDLEAGWNDCRAGIDKLKAYLEKESPHAFTSEEYMHLYTMVYNMCTQKHPYDFSSQLYQRYRESFETYITERVAPALLEKSGEAMLHELTSRWENHKLMVHLLSRIFTYLDRYYVTRQNVDRLRDVGMMCFRDIVYAKIKHNLKTAILNLIHRERECESVDRALLKSVLEIFVEIGLGSMACYQEDFEAFLLEETAAHYRAKAAEWITSDSCPDYMRKAEDCLSQEKGRVAQNTASSAGAGGQAGATAVGGLNRETVGNEENTGGGEGAMGGYVHSSTERKLLGEAETELLGSYETQLLEKENSGCSALLREGKQEDLSRMFRLFSRIPGGKDPVAAILRKHVEGEGLALVKESDARAAGLGVEGAVEKPKERPRGRGRGGGNSGASFESVYVRKLVQLHDRYLGYVQTCFQGDSLFHKALKEAFENFCNKTVGGSTCAEMLAMYCDNMLKKGSGEKLSDEAMEAMFEKIVKLLAYVADKDLFAEFYRKKLSRRLLFDRSANEDHERSMLARLKQQCGAQFTSKMEGMVTDLQLAKENQARFAEYLSSNPDKQPPIDLTVNVLTTGFWPSYKFVDLSLPKPMEDSIEIFKEFYELKTKHRRLAWIFTLGNVVVKANLARKFDLVLTTMQAATLFLFRNEERLTFQEAQGRLNLPEEDLLRMLQSLSCGKYKLLLKFPPGKLVSKSDAFELNTGFTDRMARIKVPLPPLEEKKKVIEDVDKDRRYAIDAAIVRTMKARKSLKHQELMMEVVQQLTNMFKPDVKMIKKRIEDLIAREYLERDKDNANVFRYLA